MTASYSMPLHGLDAPLTGTSRFLLLDGAQCSSVEEVKNLLPPNNAIPLFDGLLADASADTSVYLQTMPSLFDMPRFLKCANPFLLSCGGMSFIDSALGQSELAQRLTRRLDAKLSNGKEFLLRFFDGRVLPLLVDALTIDQQQHFLGIGQRWWFVNPTRQWQSITLTTPASDHHESPLFLNDNQRRKLVDSTYPYTLIEHFAFTDQELLDRVPAHDQYRFFKQCFDLAQHYGMRDGRRVAMVCTWTLLLGEGFQDNPAWNQRLTDFGTGKRTAQDIGNEVWPIVESWE